MTERHGAAHRITQTRPGATPDPAPRQTRLMGGWDSKVNMSSSTLGRMTGVRSDEHYDMSTWAGAGGHSAEVEEKHGPNSYVAGPYRTPYRAQVAAVALTDRARVDNADRYQRRRGR